MNCKNHIIAGTALVPVVDTAVKGVSYLCHIQAFEIYRTYMFGCVTDGDIFDVHITMPVCAAIAVISFLLGICLPDIDTEKSLISKIIKIPIHKLIEHRTWTHTMWGIIALFTAGLLFYDKLWFLNWIAYGCFMHILCDSWSRAGICWFYPISKYKSFPGGAKIKDGHFIYMYKTGEKSENVAAGALVFIGIAFLILGFSITL